MNKGKERNLLLGIFLAALVVRLLFIFVGARYYYGPNIHLHNDTFSFTGCFLNLLKHGVYTFDLSNPDAYFYRLPGYPFFWGIHYLVFGAARADLATSITQALLDAAAAVMVYGIAERLSEKKEAALLAGAVYAFYPFVIVWVPQIVTESFATFCTVLFFWALYRMREGYGKWVVLGVLACLALYVRTYLGILLVCGALYPFFCCRDRWPRRLAFAGLFVLTFSLTLAPWVLRNVYLQKRPVILMGETTGYAAYGRDFTAFHNWVTLWQEDVGTPAKEVALKGEIALPDLPGLDDSERREIREAVQAAYRSGSSFHERRVWAKVADPAFRTCAECDRDVAARFAALRSEFIKKRPWYALTVVPLQNVKKLFFKSDLAAGPAGAKRLLVTLLFGYRSLLVIIGMVAIAAVVVRRQTFAWPIAFYPLFMFFYITSIMRHLEMRYVLQADVIVILFASIGIVSAFGRSRAGSREEVTRRSVTVID